MRYHLIGKTFQKSEAENILLMLTYYMKKGPISSIQHKLINSPYKALAVSIFGCKVISDMSLACSRLLATTWMYWAILPDNSCTSYYLEIDQQPREPLCKAYESYLLSMGKPFWTLCLKGMHLLFGEALSMV
jgi:hypothetical protein